jgi:Fibronectin type III domain
MSGMFLFCVGPSVPRNVLVTAGNSNELHVTWDKPAVPNGIITHYIVYWRLLPLHTEKWTHVDFCMESKSVLWLLQI